MYQVLRKEVTGNDGTGVDTVATLPGNKTESEPLNVSWLPSLPLTKKHNAPPISGLGILYSEELEQVLHVFETDNLKEGINRISRNQAAALNIDPGCRLHWLEIANPARRALSRLKLLTQIQAA